MYLVILITQMLSNLLLSCGMLHFQPVVCIRRGEKHKDPNVRQGNLDLFNLLVYYVHTRREGITQLKDKLFYKKLFSLFIV